MSRRILFTLIVTLILMAGCSSGGQNPVGSQSDNTGYQDIRGASQDAVHLLWGVYDVNIDPASLSVDFILNRSADPHYNVTQYVTPPQCSDCVKAKVLSLDPDTKVATIEITLKNPYPMPGFDVRGILLLNSAGHDLLNPDGWVSIWDDGTPPEFNPFRRFGKDDPDGTFPGGASLKEIYVIQLPTPPKYSQIKFAIDAFRPKTGFREAYAITDMSVDTLLFSDGSNNATLQLKVLDRNNDVAVVTAEAPDLFTGKKEMVNTGIDTWSVQFSNENLAPSKADPYYVTIEASDPHVSYTLRNRAPVYVMELTLGWMPQFNLQQVSTCTPDIAGISNGTFVPYGAYLIDGFSGCTKFNAFDMGFGAPFPAVNLNNLNPLNPTLQPFPPVRFDSAKGGGLVFSNESDGMFIEGYTSARLKQVVVTLDSTMNFFDDGAGDRQCHFPGYSATLGVADVCGGRDNRVYMLWAETNGTDLPVFRGYGPNYSTKHQVIGTVIPAEFIGEGDGKVQNDVEAIAGIDVFESETAPPIHNVKLAILETTATGGQVEIFNVYTDDYGVSEVTHELTIDLPAAMGIPIDIEILPPKENYLPNPDAPSLVVLFRYDYAGLVGGYLDIYDLATGDVVDNLGSNVQPMVFESATYVDIIDATFTIIAVSEMGGMPGGVMIFSFTYQ